jgi:threonyl-tRNA synthetase
MIVYKSSPKTYKNFPMKVAELGEVHRQELSGVLGGLFRVIQFTQDDAHIYCTMNKLKMN